MGKLRDYDLAVLDAKYIAWRSFYAHNMLSIRMNGERVGTGLAYGFMQTVMLVLRSYPAKTLAIAWDSKTSRRKKIYEGYKGNRKKDDIKRDEFDRQLSVLKEILKYSAFPEYIYKGEEADDIIASLVTQTPGRKLIVGSDHDLFQLLSKDTKMLVLKAKNFEEVWNPRIFREKHGIPAWKFWQVMALMGDSGDSVPGLRGIGPVTAVKLLNEYPDFVKGVMKWEWTMPEELYAYFKKKYGDVDEVIETIRLARKLTKLNKKIPLRPRKKKPSLNRMLDVLARYEFQSMLAGDRRAMLRRTFRTKS